MTRLESERMPVGEIKSRSFRAENAEGKGERWEFGRKYWMGVGGSDSGFFWWLRGPDGTVRVLARTWELSVPLIRTVLENYGVKAEIS